MSHGLRQAWETTVRRRGLRRAVVQAGNGQAVTFRELDERADAWLGAQGPEARQLQGRAVVFAAANGIGWLEIFEEENIEEPAQQGITLKVGFKRLPFNLHLFLHGTDEYL